MKVNSVENNTYKTQNFSTPQFKAKGMDPDIWNHLNKNSGKVARFFSYVGENQGEALNIIVTAVGTAIICPLFIAFNPFSKEDSKTKQYSAWRQPISAVIALVTQLTITKWFNDWITKAASTSDKQGNTRFATRADLRACPHERYLKRIIKLEHPEFDKKQISEEVQRRQIDAEKTEISKMRKAMKDKPIEYKELVCQDYIDKAKENFFKEFKETKKEEIEKKFGKSLDDIRSLKLNKHLEKMLEDKAKLLGKDTQTLLNETAVKLVEKDVLAETVAKISIRHLSKKGIKVSEAIDYCTDKEKVKLENLANLIREQGLEAKLPEGYDAEKLAKDIVDKLTNMQEYESKCQMKDFASTKNIGNTYEEILQSVKIKRFVKSRTSDAKRVFKTMNTQLGLLVTLATLPFTCGFLNWCYPRIMEKIMPEMSAKKKQVEEKIGNINAKIEEAVDKLNLDEIKDIVNIDEIKNKLKFELQKGGDD